MSSEYFNIIYIIVILYYLSFKNDCVKYHLIKVLKS